MDRPAGRGSGEPDRDLAAENARLARAHEERIVDISVLVAETARERERALEEERRRGAAARAGLEARIAGLEAELGAARRAHDHDLRALHDSTSWRITAPLRRLGLLLRRMKPRG